MPVCLYNVAETKDVRNPLAFDGDPPQSEFLGLTTTELSRFISIVRGSIIGSVTFVLSVDPVARSLLIEIPPAVSLSKFPLSFDPVAARIRRRAKLVVEVAREISPALGVPLLESAS